MHGSEMLSASAKPRLRRWMLMLVLLAPLCVAAAPKKQYGKIEIVRDTWGVPHVFAETDAGALYGLGWTTAEDRAFQMHYNLRIIQGRLAELIGDVKVGATERLPQGKNSAARNDVKMRMHGYWPAAQRVAEALDEESRKLLQAYCDGVNDYVAAHPDDLLYLFEKLGLEPEPWTPAACIASWWRLGLFFSGDGLRELGLYYEIKEGRRQVRTVDPIAAAQGPPDPRSDDAAAVVQRGDIDDEWLKRVYDFVKEHKLTQQADAQPRGVPTRGAPGRVAPGRGTSGRDATTPGASERTAPSPFRPSRPQSPTRGAAARTAPEPPPKFSHAWVVGGKINSSGAAVLVSDPQTPVRNPALFYEYHFSGKTFNARGIGVPGSPMLLIGFTPDIAWGLTALGADQADLFLLKTDAAHPNQYQVDGKWLDMQSRREIVKIKDGRPRSIAVRETRFGPVVTPLALDARRGDEVAMKRVPLCETGRETIQAAWPMMRAKNAADLHRALAHWRFPSANCVFGDRQGAIGYQTVLALPVRSPRTVFGGLAAQEGWTAAADWQGFMPPDLLPQVLNPKQGWLVSANHRPIASFYPAVLGISTGGHGDTERSWRLKERMAMRQTFKPADVLAIHYDTVNPIKRELVRLGFHLRDVQKAPLEPDTKLALAHLEEWRAKGSRSEMSIPGTDIMNLLPMAFRARFAAAVKYGGGASGLCRMLKTIGARIDKNPQAALTDDEAEYVDLILRGAWRYGLSRYGDDPAKWPERAQAQLQQQKLGYMTTLDGFPSLDPAKEVKLPALECIEGGSIRSQRAQSYTQYVPLHDADQAQTILPVGQSEHPDSPWHLSAYKLWAEGKLHPAPLSRKAVEKIQAKQTTLQK